MTRRSSRPTAGADGLDTDVTISDDPFEGTCALATDWSTCDGGCRIETRSRKIQRVVMTRKGNRLMETRRYQARSS